MILEEIILVELVSGISCGSTRADETTARIPAGRVPLSLCSFGVRGKFTCSLKMAVKFIHVTVNGVHASHTKVV